MAFAAERIMDAEVEMLTGAAKGARSAPRETYRNGYRERDWDTRAGRIEPPRVYRDAFCPLGHAEKYRSITYCHD